MILIPNLDCLGKTYHCLFCRCLETQAARTTFIVNQLQSQCCSSRSNLYQQANLQKRLGMEKIHIDKHATNAVEAYLEYKRSVCLGKIGKLKSIYVVSAKIFIIFNFSRPILFYYYLLKLVEFEKAIL